jgi:hypothetical protein
MSVVCGSRAAFVSARRADDHAAHVLWQTADGVATLFDARHALATLDVHALVFHALMADSRSLPMRSIGLDGWPVIGGHQCSTLTLTGAP